MRYVPVSAESVPEELEAFRDWIENELQQISNAFTEQDIVYLRVLHVAPTKLREGMVIRADGSDWDPGAGAGVYTYLSSAWSKL